MTTLDPRILIGQGSLLSGILLLVIPADRGFPVTGMAFFGALVTSGILKIIGLGLIF